MNSDETGDELEKSADPPNDQTSAQTDKPGEGSKAGDVQANVQTVALDPRIFAYRKDLAAQSLYGRVTAPRYVAGEKRQVNRAAIAVRKTPDPAAGLETEAIFGETLTLYDQSGGWAWVQLERDNYVGYLPADALTSDIQHTTHWVKNVGTFVYPAPDIKSPPILHLTLTSEVAVKDADAVYGQKFSELKTGGFVLSRHLAEKGTTVRDFVDIAERLIETPYLWGGRTRVGMDCSALVQTSLKAAGIDAPRDTDLQQAYLGETVEINAALDRLRRGDLIYWKGHVGIMIDGIMMVHANAHHMATTVEPLPEAAARIARDNGPIVAIKRLAALSAPGGTL